MRKQGIKQFSIHYDRRLNKMDNEITIRDSFKEEVVKSLPLKTFAGIKAKVSFIHNGISHNMIKNFNDADKLSNYIEYMENKSDVKQFKIKSNI